MDCIMDSHNLILLVIFPKTDSNPKRQPPRKDKITPAYNCEKFSKKIFKCKSMKENLNGAKAPRKYGIRPRDVIILMVVGIWSI